MKKNVEKLILIDGNSIAFRAFFALPLLSNANGLHTNAVFGFTTMLLRLIEEEKPSHFLVAFDAGKQTFRHEQFKEYKGGRAKTPPELSEQFPVIRKLIAAFGIQQFELNGYEADDIIGTITRIADEQGVQAVVVSGDKDMLQLASEHVTVALTRKGISEMDRYNPEAIQAHYRLSPAQIIDLKGLMGDTSDNIPGIPGVGEKTALKLLHAYGSVEEVLARTGELTGKLQQKIIEHAESAALSKQLATIFREVPMEMEIDSFSYAGFHGQALAQLFRELGFKSLLEKLDFSTVQDSDGAVGEDDAGPEQKRKELDSIVVAEPEAMRQLAAKLTGTASGATQAMHIEMIGDNPHTAEVLGLAFDFGDVGYYVPFEQLEQTEDPSVPVIKAWLADETRAKTVYDAHKAEVALSWRGISLRGVVFDLLLAAYLLDPTQANHSLAQLTLNYELPSIPENEEVFGKGAKFQLPELAVVSEFMCRKARAVDQLTPLLMQHLERNEMSELFYKLELPLAGVLAQMETQGIRVDSAQLKEYGEELGTQIDHLAARIYALAGTEFNLNSTKQLGYILFDKLGLPVVKKTKTGYSTDAEVLEKLEPHHEIIAEILHYRQLAKLQSTYVEGLLKEIRGEGEKIHTFYQQTIAATGRLSSQYPNLQNIPIRLEEGRKIRKVFVPSEPDWLILAADYSQIELRVLAHISQDKRLIEAFANNMDIHTKTAMDVFGVAEAEVDANMRRQAKAVNFGIVYGISDYGLSQNLNITRKEAAAFIEQYFAVFQGVRKYMDDIVLRAREDGYVTTLLSRRRYLPEIKSSNFNLRSFAERTAMNTPIQGTAADIIKLAMVRMSERMREEQVESRMLLQVHDELVFEVPKQELEFMTKLVPEVMEAAHPLDVRLKADVSYGTDWYGAK